MKRIILIFDQIYIVGDLDVCQVKHKWYKKNDIFIMSSIIIINL